MAEPFPRPVGTFVDRRDALDRILSLAETETVFSIVGLAGIGKTELVFQAVESLRAKEQWDSAPAMLLRAEPGATAESLVAPLGDTLADVAATLEDAPQIVFLDDAHNLGPSEARTLLEYIDRRVRASRVFVASRRLLPIPGVVVELGPLDEAATAQLAQALAERRGVPVPNAADVYARSCGSPSLVSRAVTRPSRAPMHADVLAESLVDLDANHRAALLLLAIVGDTGNADDLSLGDDVLHALAQRFLVELDDGAVRVPRLVAAAVVDAATPEEVSALRRKAAGVHSGRFHADPEAHSGDAVAAFRQLLDSGDAAGAWELLQRTYGAVAAAALDHKLLDRIAQLRAALPDRAVEVDLFHVRVLLRRARTGDARAVLDSMPLPEPGPLRHIYRLFDAACHVRLGQMATAQRAIDDARAEADEPWARFAIDLVAADLESMAGRSERARELLDEARARRQTPSERERAMAEWSHALTLFTEERFDEAAAAARRVARALTDDLRADLAGALAIVEQLSRVERDDVTGARGLIDAIIARTEGETADTSLVAMLDGVVKFAAGDLTAARDALYTAHRAATEQRDALTIAVAGEYLGRTMLALGELDGATEVLARATAISTAAGMERLALRGRAYHAMALVETGRVADAIRRLEATLAAPNLAASSRRVALRALARGRALMGDLDAARAHLEQAGDGAMEAMTAPQRAANDLTRAELEVLGGNPDAGIEAGRRARHYYADCGRRWLEMRASLATAACYVAKGGDAALIGAERELDRATRGAADAGYAPLRLRSAPVEAGIERRKGRNDRVREVLVDGLRTAQTVGGEHADVQLLRAALDSTGASGTSSLPGIGRAVRFLGLVGSTRYEIIDRAGTRVVSEPDVEREIAARELAVDTETATISVSGEPALKKRPTVCAVLARLIRAQSRGVDAETLYCDVWGAPEYQPLKHRNTVYVTLNRVRRSLGELLPNRTVIEKIPSGWRIAEDIDACAVRRLDGDDATEPPG